MRLALGALLSICCFSSSVFAKPVLNVRENVGTFEIVIHPDSESRDVFWYHTTKLGLCTTSEGKPVAGVRAFEVNGSARMFVTFDLCPQNNEKKLEMYLLTLRSTNPRAELRPLPVVYTSAEPFSLPLAKELRFISNCIVPDVRETKISCGIFSHGTRASTRLYDMLSMNYGQLTANYVHYSVAGTELLANGQYQDKTGDYKAIYYIYGFKSYPELFDTEWKPTRD